MIGLLVPSGNLSTDGLSQSICGLLLPIDRFLMILTGLIQPHLLNTICGMNSFYLERGDDNFHLNKTWHCGLGQGQALATNLYSWLPGLGPGCHWRVGCGGRGVGVGALACRHKLCSFDTCLVLLAGQ